MNGKKLTSSQKEYYSQKGYVILRDVFSQAECDDFIEYMMDLHAGRRKLNGFTLRQADEWGRTHNQHAYDPVAMAWLMDMRLRQPLYDCLGEDAEGIQTMYFWKGSEQRRHQDQFYLPSCMSAWIALQNIGVDNGTIYVQPGSHKNRLITRYDFEDAGEFHGMDYSDAVDLLFERNNLPEIQVEVSAGDVVLFHGVLVHRGGLILNKKSFRHVLANHYIPHGFTGWHLGWPRYSFDGDNR